MWGKVLLIGLALLGALWTSLGIQIGQTLPPHAWLLVDTIAKSYVTVPCVIASKTDRSYVSNVKAVLANMEGVRYEPNVLPMRRDEAVSDGNTADRACADAGGFVHLEPWLVSVLGWGRQRVSAEGDVLW